MTFIGTSNFYRYIKNLVSKLDENKLTTTTTNY